MKNDNPPGPKGVVVNLDGQPRLECEAETRFSSNAPHTVEQLIGLAQSISIARDKRPEFLPSELFAEPAWDMLIALFRANEANRRTTVSNLCYESRVAYSTALRWIDKLIELGFARRTKHPYDARVIFVDLEPRGRLAVREYLSQIWNVFYDP